MSKQKKTSKWTSCFACQEALLRHSGNPIPNSFSFRFKASLSDDKTTDVNIEMKSQVIYMCQFLLCLDDLELVYATSFTANNLPRFSLAQHLSDDEGQLTGSESEVLVVSDHSIFEEQSYQETVHAITSFKG